MNSPATLTIHMEETWTRIDSWIGESVGDRDDVLEAALTDSEAADMPAIAVSRAAGKFLHLIARLRGARRILEVGTLGGYSTIWMARALPHDGRLVTLEIREAHAAVARRNIERAGLSSRVEILTGPAANSLERMKTKGIEPFDLLFIDADKRSNDVYFDYALALARAGSVIIVDNVVRAGRVLDTPTDDPDIQGIQRMMARIRKESRVTATALQTVGAKGHDGFLFAIVN
jgi:predicted O-methyltransferase YrrM